jgi:hypothetical protein
MIIYIIKILHLLLFLILFSSIFVPISLVKQLSLLMLVFLLLQFIVNQGECCLTQLEYYFTKEKYKEGFLYRLITPVIKRNEKYFDYYFYIFHLLWIIILIYQITFYYPITDTSFLLKNKTL